MTSGVSVDGLQEVRNALDRLRQNGGELPTDTLAQLGAEHTRNNFKQGTDPWGGPWKKVQRSGQDSSDARPLVDTGRLRDSIGTEADKDRAAWGSKVQYAPVHQFGARTPAQTIRPKRKKALFWPGAKHPVKKVEHPGSDIPARPFLPIENEQANLPDDLAEDMLDVINKRLRRLTNG